MKLLTDWGFTRDSWRGDRGEYLVALQGLLIIGFALLPVYPQASVTLPMPVQYGIWAIAGGIALFAGVLLGKGLLDLGENLTPLPYPKDEGKLVQSGVYGIVRHCLYSGLILVAIAYTLWQLSLSHAIATIILFLFFNAKASREEAWLTEKYPDYPEYQQRVKKLLPLIF